MSHFLSVLCGLGSVLTEVGVISDSYLSAVLLGREDSKQQREINTYSQLERATGIYRSWSGNTYYYYFRSNYIMKVL